MSARTLFRRRERHGLHVADALAADPGHDDGRWTGPGEAPLPQLQISEEVQAELGRLREQALAEHAVALAAEHEDFYGWDTTMLDQRAPLPRPYIPGVLGSQGRLTPVSASVADDLAGLVLFRDTVSAEIIRRDRGNRTEGGTWGERYTRAFEDARAGWSVTPPLPDFGIGAMMLDFFGGMDAMHPEREVAA